MNLDELTPHLPQDAVCTETTTPKGEPVLNITTPRWQAAIRLPAEDEAIILEAVRQEALYEHKQALAAANKAYKKSLDDLAKQHKAKLDTKVVAATDRLKQAKRTKALAPADVVRVVEKESDALDHS
jgi:hypothetical protein